LRTFTTEAPVAAADQAAASAAGSLLVGRQKELELLRSCVLNVSQGRGGVVNLVGEGGIGKSRLVAELRRDEQPFSEEGLWLEGRAPALVNQALPYWSWQGLLRDWLKSDETEREAETQRKLQLQLEQLLDDAQAQAQVYPYLATILSLQLEQPFAERVMYLDAPSLQTQTFLAVRAWLERLAQVQPLIVIMDDLRQADATSLELLSYCFPLVVELPLLFINLLRPERENACWQLRDEGEMTLAPLGRYTEIILGRLNPQESDELIYNLLQRQTVPASLTSIVGSRAEGNPLFTEEIVRSLIEHNVLVHDALHRAWTIAGATGDLGIPDTLLGVINARINRLPDETRRVLQRSAVVGRVFWERVVAQLDAGQGVAPHLERLLQAGLIRQQGDVPALGKEYAFRHALMHQAAYASIPEPQRRAYHRQAAAFIESSFADRLEEYYGLLAHHTQRADDREKACHYAHQAAERAAGRYANQEALKFYQQALELLTATDVKSRARRFDLLQKLQTVYARLGQTQARQRALKEMLRLASLLNDSDRLIEVYVDQAALYQGTNLQQAEESARLGLRLARVMEHHSGEARALLQRAWINRRLWRKRQAISQGEAALRACRRAGDYKIEGRVLCDLANFYAFNYDFETALGYGTQALQISQEQGDRSTEVEARLSISKNLSALGRHDEAIDATQKTVDLAQQINDRRREASSLNILGSIYTNAGQHGQAIEVFQQALAIYHQIDDRMYESWVYGNIGWMHVRLGRYEAALERFQASHDASRRVDNRSVEARALMSMAALRRQVGQYTEAQQLANTARSIVPRVGWREIERWALGELSLAAWWSGSFGPALGLAQTALGHAHYQQDLQAIGWNTALLASVHVGWPWFEPPPEAGSLHLALRLALQAQEIGRLTYDREVQIWGAEALSLAHWLLGQQQEALEWSQRTIELLEDTPGYAESRVPLYFEHSLILRASGRQAQADDFFQLAQVEMLRRADLMSDPAMRSAYLEQVPVNRAIQS
jgi:predicted ATPase